MSSGPVKADRAFGKQIGRFGPIAAGLPRGEGQSAMTFRDLLAKKKDAVVDGWIETIIETYPDETARFLKNKKDRFANPVGASIQTETERLFDLILEGIEPEKATKFLDNIIRIRAIQEFTPSQALAFVFALKHVVRNVLKSELAKGGHADDLWRLDKEIDRLALISFEIYMSVREQLYQLKAKEVQSNAYMLLRRSGMLVEEGGGGADEGESDS